LIEKIQLSVIYNISKVLTSHQDIHKNLEYIANILISYLDYKRVFISLENPITGKLESIGNLNLSYRKGEGITGKVWKYGIPIVIPDISKEPEFLNKLISLSDIDIPTRLDPDLLRPADVTLQIPSIEKFLDKTSWKPKISFEKSIKDLLEYWRMEVKRSLQN